MLHLVLTAVARSHQVGDQRRLVYDIAGAESERGAVTRSGAQPLHERPTGCHDDPGTVGQVAQAVQHVQTTTHSLDTRADPLKRQRLPCGEQLDLVGTHVLAQVSGQELGLGARGNGDYHRSPPGLAGDGCQHDRPGRLRHGEDRMPSTHHTGESRLVVQQVGKGLQQRPGHRKGPVGPNPP